MAFFDELTKKAQTYAGVAVDKAKDLAGVASEKAKEVADSAKINMAIMTEQRELECVICGGQIDICRRRLGFGRRVSAFAAAADQNEGADGNRGEREKKSFHCFHWLHLTIRIPCLRTEYFRRNSSSNTVRKTMINTEG